MLNHRTEKVKDWKSKKDSTSNLWRFIAKASEYVYELKSQPYLIFKQAEMA